MSGTIDGADTFFLTEALGKMGLLQTGEYAILQLYTKYVQNTAFDASSTPSSAKYFLSKFSTILITQWFKNKKCQCLESNDYTPALTTPLPHTVYHNYRSSVFFTESLPSKASEEWKRFGTALSAITKFNCSVLDLCGFSVPPFYPAPVRKYFYA
jgi:hypothetical protein